MFTALAGHEADTMKTTSGSMTTVLVFNDLLCFLESCFGEPFAADAIHNHKIDDLVGVQHLEGIQVRVVVSNDGLVVEHIAKL